MGEEGIIAPAREEISPTFGWGSCAIDIVLVVGRGANSFVLRLL